MAEKKTWTTREILVRCESKLGTIQAAKQPVTIVYSKDGEHFTVKMVKGGTTVRSSRESSRKDGRSEAR